MLGVVFVRVLYYTTYSIRRTYSDNMKLQLYAQLKTHLPKSRCSAAVLPGPLYGRIETWPRGSILVIVITPRKRPLQQVFTFWVVAYGRFDWLFYCIFCWFTVHTLLTVYNNIFFKLAIQSFDALQKLVKVHYSILITV